jgi:hypothetical protein
MYSIVHQQHKKSLHTVEMGVSEYNPTSAME